MEKENLKKINDAYEELRGMLFGLGDVGAGKSIINGPVTQYETVVKNLSALTGQDLSRFLPRISQYDHGEWVAEGLELKTSANSLVAWLRTTYLEDKTPHYEQSSGPSTSVNVSQDVNVTQSLIVDITGILTAKETEFPEDSKERSFIQKVKAGLGGVKDAASIFALVAKTANDLGLTTEQLAKIFS